MNISSTPSAETITRAMNADAPDAGLQVKMQIRLLQKTLQAQQDQTAELMKMAEGKGHILDVRA